MIKGQILKLLKQYCYVIVFGIFGMYIASWIGMLLLGLWGLWCDRKKASSLVEAQKEKTMSDTVSQKMIWLFCLALPWWYVSTVFMSSCITGITLGLISGSNRVRQTNMPDITSSLNIVSSNVIEIFPFVNNYLNYLNEHVLKNTIVTDVTLISFLFIMCVIRIPKLILLFDQFYNKQCLKLVNSKIFQFIVVLLTVMCLLLFSFCFLGIDYWSVSLINWLSLEDNNVRSILFFNLLLLPILFVITVFLTETAKQVFIIKNVRE